MRSSISIRLSELIDSFCSFVYLSSSAKLSILQPSSLLIFTAVHKLMPACPFSILLMCVCDTAIARASSICEMPFWIRSFLILSPTFLLFKVFSCSISSPSQQFINKYYAIILSYSCPPARH